MMIGLDESRSTGGTLALGEPKINTRFHDGRFKRESTPTKAKPTKATGGGFACQNGRGKRRRRQTHTLYDCYRSESAQASSHVTVPFWTG